MKLNSFVKVIFDAVFGYDFFISYTWKDGGNYAKSLHRKLTNQGFTVFLDRQDLVMGDDWSLLARRAIRKTKQLVIVITPSVHNSPAVLEEVAAFVRTERRIIPIELQDGLDSTLHADSPLTRLLPASILRLTVDNSKTIPENPSDEVINQLRRGFDHVRQSTHRIRLLTAASVLLLVLTLVAGTFAYLSHFNEKRAVDGETLANNNAVEAKKQGKKAEKERQRAVQTLSASDFEAGCRLLEEDHPNEGIPYLARSVRGDNRNRPAIVRLYNYLADAGHLLPVCPPILHGGEIVSASFSPDGKEVLTASRNGTAAIWQRDTGEIVQPVMKHDGPVTGAVFSPDGMSILTTSEDQTARLWSAATHMPSVSPMKHEKPIAAAEFNNDGSFIVTSSADGAVKVWRTSDGKMEAEITPPESMTDVFRTAFSPDGKRIFMLSREDGAQLVEFNKDLKLGPLVSGSGYTNSAVFSPDGKYLLIASDDSTAQKWDAETGREAGKPFQHKSYVNEAVFSPDGLTVMTASSDGSIYKWNPKEGKLTGKATPTGLPIRNISISPDGNWLAAADEDGTIKLYNMKSGAVHGNPLPHAAFVTMVRFSNDGRYLITASRSGAVQIWHVRCQKMLPMTLRHQTPVNRVEFVGEDRQLLTAEENGRTSVWSLESSKTLSEWRTGQSDPVASDSRNGENVVRSIVLRPDQKGIIAITLSGVARLLDDKLKLGQVLFEGRQISHVLKAENGSAWATASKDGRVQLWNELGTAPIGAEVACQGELADLTLSSSGQYVLVTRKNHQEGTAVVELWSTSLNKQAMPAWNLNRPVFDVGFSHDDRFFGIATGNDVKIWTLPEIREVALDIHYRWNAYGPIFGRSSHTAITRSEDNSLSVWNVGSASAGKKIPSEHGMSQVAWFWNDEMFVTASYDNSGRVWHTLSGLPLSEILHHDTGLPPVKNTTVPSGTLIYEWTGNRDNKPNRAYASRDDAGGGVNSVVYSTAVEEHQRLVATAGSDGTARIWEVIPPAAEPPDWFPLLAEGLSGKRLNEQNGLESVSREQLVSILATCRALKGSTPWDTFGRWIAAAPETRTIAPSSNVTVHDELVKEAEWFSANGKRDESLRLVREAEFIDGSRPVKILKSQSIEEALSPDRSDGRIPEGVGFLYGNDHLVALRAPSGWVLDNQVLSKIGVHAAFYPKEFGFSEAPSVIYVSVGPSRKEGLDGIGMETIDEFEKRGGELKLLSEGRNSYVIGKDSTLIAYLQRRAGTTSYEKVLYISETPLLVKIIITAKTDKDLKDSEAAFREFVNDYRMVSHNPDEAVLHALRENDTAELLKRIGPALQKSGDTGRSDSAR